MGLLVLGGTRMDDVARLADTGPWDAVVDTSGYVPRETLAVCELLEPIAARYVFMSTVSVYRGCDANCRLGTGIEMSSIYRDRTGIAHKIPFTNPFTNGMKRGPEDDPPGL